ncbi:hypothetical protein MOQ72_32070 [Saccharopolyspora sp. K220]|uniref:hypothetical protein n=1 Tax=Saccharopolyspora soli TaxID=2926618 RepID=UPI001F569249|nr:hypothetical protein [Saccharopolyspora soli]MCI2422079.1 hypothetical protein [Saccharopolyspora soli]
MADPTGDDDRSRTNRKTGRYFVLPSELAEELRRTEADLEKSPERAIEEKDDE